MAESIEANEYLKARLSYRVDEEVPGTPGKPVQDPDLAEKLAHEEKPYRELMKHAESLGLTDAKESLGGLADNAIRDAERAHYQLLGVTKAEIKAAHHVLGTFSDEGAKEALLDGFIRDDSEQLGLTKMFLDDLRSAARTFQVGSVYVEPKAISVRSDNTELYKEYERCVVRYKNAFGGLPVSFNSRSKIESTLRTLTLAAREYRRKEANIFEKPSVPRASDGIQAVMRPVVHEVFTLQENLARLVGAGKLTQWAAESVFTKYDLAKLSVDQFEDISKSLLRDGSNLNELIAPFMKPSERHLEILRKDQEVRSVAARDRKAQEKVDLLEKAASEEAALASSLVGNEAALDETEAWQRIAQSNPGVAEMIQGIKWDEVSLVELSSRSDVNDFLEGLNEYIAIRTGKAASEAQLNIDELWRKLDRPKGYYGGRIGGVSLTVKPLVGIEVGEKYTMPDYTEVKQPEVEREKRDIARIGLFVETVKDFRGAPRVDLVSYTEFTISAATGAITYSQDAKRKLTISDEDRLTREHRADIRVGRVVEVTQKLRPLDGGIARGR